MYKHTFALCLYILFGLSDSALGARLDLNRIPHETFRVEMVPAWPRRGEPTISYKIYANNKLIFKHQGEYETDYYYFNHNLLHGEYPNKRRAVQLLQSFKSLWQVRHYFGYLNFANVIAIRDTYYALVYFSREQPATNSGLVVQTGSVFSEHPNRPILYSKAILFRLGRLRSYPLLLYDVSFLNHLSGSQASAKEKIEAYIHRGLMDRLNSKAASACADALKSEVDFSEHILDVRPKRPVPH